MCRVSLEPEYVCTGRMEISLTISISLIVFNNFFLSDVRPAVDTRTHILVQGGGLPIE